MADIIVNVLLENLSKLVTNEANLLWGVQDQVNLLNSQLGIMKAFLESCPRKHQKSPIEQEIVRQIKDLAHEAEDVIDTFVCSVANYRRKSWSSRIIHGANPAKLRYHVGKKIKNINARLNLLHVDKIINYDTQEVVESPTELQLLLHKRRRYVEEDDVVGFQHDTTKVINLLKRGSSHRDVVSIIGMGGLGKTTLARKIYNSDHVKDYFECHAWVYVSNDYRPRELLLALYKQLVTISSSSSRKLMKGKGKDDFHSMSEDELRDEVRKCLQGKRYLVVLDDVWSPQHWNDLQHVFPDDNKSSRILITSRWKDVASQASPSPYYLPYLSEDESWELFSKRVFRGGEGVPSDLEQVGKRMVKSCGGLPISIVVLAGILANKEKSYREWSKVEDHVNSYLTKPDTQVQDIVLKLSYDSLPTRLRPCFLYLGMFPEDSEIRVQRLIQLWVSEGFILLHNDSRVEEDVAEEYLEELVSRSLVQVGRKRSDGGIKTCRIHDLLRELCISKSNDEKFFEVCRDANTSEQTKPRRLSIQCRDVSDLSVLSNKDLSCSRSVLFFASDHQSLALKLDSKTEFVYRLRIVRVLDLEAPRIHKLSKVFINLNVLAHLRYLRIDPIGGCMNARHGLVFPKLIRNLWNLEILDLSSSAPFLRIYMSLSGIWKLKRLRHIYATGGAVVLPEFPTERESKTMGNLQTLSVVSIKKESSVVSFLKGKGAFPNLRTLGLSFEKGDGNEQCIDQVWENLSNLNSLNALKIYGNFPSLPTSITAFPSKLTKLTMKYIHIIDNNAMRTFGGLNSLRILKLDRCELSPGSNRELCCMYGFPQLEVFEMKYMSSLHNWKLGKDVMSCLRRLVILGCHKLTSLPDELGSLTSLQEIQFESIYKSVEMQLQEMGATLIN